MFASIIVDINKQRPFAAWASANVRLSRLFSGLMGRSHVWSLVYDTLLLIIVIVIVEYLLK